jgi:hypothetical protein
MSDLTSLGTLGRGIELPLFGKWVRVEVINKGTSISIDPVLEVAVL